MERAWTSEELPLSGVDWSRTGAGGVTKDALGATLAGGGGPAMPKYTTRQYSQNTGLYAKGTISKAMRLSLPSTSRYHGSMENHLPLGPVGPLNIGGAGGGGAIIPVGVQ